MTPTKVLPEKETREGKCKTERVIFYGASRFDCPAPGYTFRNKDGRILSLTAITPEFLGHRADDLSLPSWRFITDCRPMTAGELRRIGDERPSAGD